MNKWHLIVALASTAACGVGGPEVSYAPGFSRPHHRVAVLGVFKDGRMDEPAWTEIAPELGAAFGPVVCQSAYDARLRAAAPELFVALDERARDDGVTSELLGPFAAHTTADLILVVNVYGRPPKADSGDRKPSAASSPTPMGRGGGGRGGGGRGRGGRGRGAPPLEQSPDQPSRFEVGASLFSAQARDFVAALDIKQPGATVTEAAANLAKNLATMIPHSTCVGWDWIGSVPASPAPATSVTVPSAGAD